MGKCPDCGAWDALEEHRVDSSAVKDPQQGLAAGWDAAALQEEGAASGKHEAPEARPIADAVGTPEALRVSTGVGELDRVLGGGLVAGSAVLIGGDPGIGKSTLLLQAASKMAGGGVRVLYVSSEESAEQVRLRAGRVAPPEQRHGSAGRAADASRELWALADTNLARIVEQVRRVRPSVVVIDSIQMIYKADLDASPGSIAQLRRCCTELVYLAKVSGVAIVLVGHVTKDGALAGPRLLEHLVDAVLYFEGDRHHAHRVVRAVKNRFGTTLEVGLFEMTGEGLREVKDGAGGLASSEKPTPGSVVCPVMTGSRCLLVEVQALTATGFPGVVKRKTSGVDASRVAMLIAVLEQHGGLRLSDRDVFASAVGGVRVVEPAADLALALAIAGAQFKKALGKGTAVVGEVGLGGEVRAVSQMEARVREAVRLGYRRVVGPRGQGSVRGVEVEYVGVGRVQEGLGELG